MQRYSEQDDESVREPLNLEVSESDEEMLSHRPHRHLPPPLMSRKSFYRRSGHSSYSLRLLLLRVSKFTFRIFPRLLVVIVIAVLLLALLPGGWRVALCAANLIPAPALRPGENITFIGHRGCEFPYPENSLQALRSSAKEVRFVEVDISLTSDGQVVAMHDQKLDRTTNGTGVACSRSLAYIKKLALKIPNLDPRRRAVHGKFCSRASARGYSMPCTYRVPTLKDIFDDLPDGTQFMIDIRECFTDDKTSLTPKCSNCSLLMESTRAIMEGYAVKPENVIFKSSRPKSLKVFEEGIPSSSFSLSLDQSYSHYKQSSLRDLMADGKYNSAAMHYALAAVRPDLVRMLRTMKPRGVGKLGDVYAWTITKDLDYKFARCAGVSNMIVAEPHRMKRRFNWDVAWLR